jgi:hypothetical protein
MPPPADRFDKVRRAWIAAHQGASTIQRRCAEVLGRRVRSRQRQAAAAVPDPHDDTVLRPLGLRSVHSQAAQVELIAVVAAAQMRSPRFPSPKIVTRHRYISAHESCRGLVRRDSPSFGSHRGDRGDRGCPDVGPNSSGGVVRGPSRRHCPPRPRSQGFTRRAIAAQPPHPDRAVRTRPHTGLPLHPAPVGMDAHAGGPVGMGFGVDRAACQACGCH